MPPESIIQHGADQCNRDDTFDDVPDTNVHMDNLMPLIRQLPVAGQSLFFNLFIALLIFLILFIIILFKYNWHTFWHKPIDPSGDQVWYATLRYRFCFWLSALR